MPQFIVKMKCVVHKLVTCENCTEEQAREEPWEHAVSEVETSQHDWEVLSVKPARASTGSTSGTGGECPLDIVTERHYTQISTPRRVAAMPIVRVGFRHR